MSGTTRTSDRARRQEAGAPGIPVGPAENPLLPVPADLSDHLPGVEPERRVNDWGRSERVEQILDRTIGDFLYHYWFRVEVEGIEHVPSDGGALLVSNHAGAVPPDGAMIAKAIKEEQPRGRPVHLTMEHWFRSVPGVNMVVSKIGGVPAHPANVHRLLHDEQELVLVFPEGRKGTEKLFKDRYRLQRFGRGGFVEAAMRARAPIVPIAVVGAEEAMPAIAHVPLLNRVAGLLYAPVTPLFPLPAKFKIRFLPPVPTDDMGDAPWEDPGLVQSTAEQVRDTIQDELHDMLAKRASVWLG